MTGLAQFIAVAMFVALLVVVWQWRERRRSLTIANLARAGGPFHCVAIRPRAGCCGAARRLAGVRYLSRQAPTLPLAECTVRTCRCTYVHYEDRRNSDRRMPFAPRRTGSMIEQASERRRGVDRRRGVAQERYV